MTNFKRETSDEPSGLFGITVLPTSGTANLNEDKWGCEMVVRSATTSYCALGMFDSVKSDSPTVREIFESTCADIGQSGVLIKHFILQ
ncbi:MAG: HindVP family restriction endonuclease [Deferribacteraceae bacterium]|jgi:hypothetical protein|nr:HindVP family restriction endonuclease [Deferribacteraceae bacterium]